MPKVAPGLPDPKQYGDLNKLTAGQLLDWIVQQHDARRAGTHYDVRFGDSDKGLYSWAVRKGLPTPGNKHLAVMQPVHEHEYRKFEGDIAAGYGAGTVRKQDEGKVLITKVAPGHINFTLAHKRYPERFTLIRPKDPNDKKWLLLNSTPTSPIPYEKVKYTKVDAEDVDDVLKNLQPNSSVQAKIDGAASLMKVLKDKIEIVSYRQSKVHGGPITHTERVFHGIPDVKPAKQDVGSVLRGELYGLHGKRTSVPQELGAILNSNVAKSITEQRDKNISLHNMVFDVHQHGNKPVGTQVPYLDRLQLAKDILGRIEGPDSGTIKSHVHPTDDARTPATAQALWQSVRTGKYPLTNEGIIIHPPTGKPSKVKLEEEQDAFIRGFFPGRGKWTDRGVGGFVYSHEPDGPIAGEVGTGFNDETRMDMFKNPANYVGQKARIRHMGKLNSGALFQPSYLGLHLG